MKLAKLLVTTAFFSTFSSPAFAQEEAQQPDEPVAEDEDAIVVIGTRQSRYIIEPSDALTGLDLDFLENPRNTTFIPEQLILDRKITDLEEALRNVPGVSQGDGFGGTNDDFFLRGFRRNAVYRDGFRRATNFKMNTTNVEYIQAVRGPASITYGQVEPGGVVDIITKRPLDELRVFGEARYGDFDDSLFLVDASVPITDRIALRVVASTQDASSFRDFTDIKRDTVSASLDVGLSDATKLQFAYEFRDEARPLDRGTVALRTPNGFEVLNRLVDDVPISRRFGAEFEIFESEFNFFEARLNHDFDDIWAIQLAAAYEDSLANDLQARPQAAFVLDADDPRLSDEGFLTPAFFAGIPTGVPPQAAIGLFLQELNTNLFDDPTDRVFVPQGVDGSRNRDTEVLFLDARVTGEFNLGGIRNRVAFGVDYRDSKQDRLFVRGALADGITVPLLNARDPIFGLLPGDFSLDGVPLDTSRGEEFGVYLNVYADLTDTLGLLVGGRYSDTEDSFEREGLGDLSASSADGFQPQIGLNWQFAENFSAFASYAESFFPNNVVDPGAAVIVALPPEQGEQFEGGVKAEFFGGRLQTSVVLYDITKTNVITGFEADGTPILVDGQTSRGVELSVTGQPIPGMNVVVAYAYTDAEITGGTRPQNVADNTFNIYASYEVQGGPLEGLGFGAGLFHQGERFGNNANTLLLQNYTLVDASLWYTIAAPSAINENGRIRFQLAAKNLFDELYFPAVGNQVRINVGPPQAFIGSVSFDF
ncbi:MAG: TonB-dependent receptor [Pseudomonadota bacterium]